MNEPRMMLMPVLAAWTIAATDQPTKFHYSAHLGTTTATVDAWATPYGTFSFRVGGHLVVRDGSRVLLSADPWPLTGVQNGKADGSAISIDSLDLARLSDAQYPEVLLTTSGCGANCNGATTILTYSSASSAYRGVTNANTFYGQPGDVTTIAGRQYLNATLPSPFFDCHACGNGTTPLLVRIRNGALVDEMSDFPDRLRTDAQQAWRDYESAVTKGDNGVDPPFDDALFRYYADEVRLGQRAAAIERIRALPKMHGRFDSFLSQSDERLRSGGIR